MKENQVTEKQNTGKKFDWFFVVGCIAFATVFFCDVFFLARNIYLHPNADLSSEMILAKLLRDEHKWITPNWFYSTELRVIAIAPIYSLFFYVSDKWDTVRMLGSVLMYILFSAGIYYFCSRLIKDGRWIAPICCAIMLLPFSFEWQNMLLTGMYYAPQVAAAFVEMALLLDIIATPSEKKGRRVILLSLTLVISFLSGLGGPRMIIMQYIPLLMCGFCMIRKHFFFFMITVFNLFSVGIGFGINLILKASGAFVYSTYSHVAPSFFSLDKLKNPVFDLVKNCGAKGGFSDYQCIFGCLFAGILWVAFALGFLYVVIKEISGMNQKTKDSKDDYTGLKIVILYTAFQLLVFLMLYQFTTMDYQARYNIHILAFIVPAACAIIGRKWRFGLLIAAFVASVLCIGNYASYTVPDNTFERYSAVADYLVSNDLNEGYASFWNANLLTEMTDGEINVWILESDANRRDMTSSDTIFPNDGRKIVPAQWLQVKTHENTSPKNPYFVIVTNEEYDRYIKDKNFYDEHFVMIRDNLRLYVFEQ